MRKGEKENTLLPPEQYPTVLSQTQFLFGVWMVDPGTCFRIIRTSLFGALLLALVLPSFACSSSRRGVANAVGDAAAPPAATQARYSRKLMIFGGQDHKTYLGCLDCSEYAGDSVFNKYGSYGSQFSSDSIWNHYSDYGSKYSDWGACNSYANDPPVIVDQEGNFFGRLTLNQYHPQLGIGSKFYNWLDGSVCGG